MRAIKKALNERNLVVILFVMVFIAFSFAQKESKKLEKLYIGFTLHGPANRYTSTEKTAVKLPAKSQEATKKLLDN